MGIEEMEAALGEYVQSMSNMREASESSKDLGSRVWTELVTLFSAVPISSGNKDWGEVLDLEVQYSPEGVRVALSCPALDSAFGMRWELIKKDNMWLVHDGEGQPLSSCGTSLEALADASEFVKVLSFESMLDDEEDLQSSTARRVHALLNNVAGAPTELVMSNNGKGTVSVDYAVGSWSVSTSVTYSDKDSAAKSANVPSLLDAILLGIFDVWEAKEPVDGSD